MEEGNCGPVINTNCGDAVKDRVTRVGGAHTLEVLRTLPLLAWLADDFDRPTRKNCDDPLRLILPSGARNFDKCFDLLLLLVHVRDKQLFPNTAAYVSGTSRRVRNIKGFAHSCRPLDIALLARSLARNGHRDSWWNWFRFITATSDIRPPRVADQDCGGRRA
jgi:hypothetical protein